MTHERAFEPLITDEVTQLRGVVAWSHRTRTARRPDEGGPNRNEAHALVRFLSWNGDAHRVAVVSELQTSPEGLYVTEDLPGVIEAAKDWVAGLLVTPLDRFVWLIHHGPFSAIGALQQEEFTEMGVTWHDGRPQPVAVDDRHRLKGAALQDRLRDAPLEPVLTVLSRLGAPLPKEW
ncbi:MAG: hypothetical protein AAGA48_20820 [Myxococcota bacterium]